MADCAYRFIFALVIAIVLMLVGCPCTNETPEQECDNEDDDSATDDDDSSVVSDDDTTPIGTTPTDCNCQVVVTHESPEYKSSFTSTYDLTEDGRVCHVFYDSAVQYDHDYTCYYDEDGLRTEARETSSAEPEAFIRWMYHWDDWDRLSSIEERMNTSTFASLRMIYAYFTDMMRITGINAGGQEVFDHRYTLDDDGRIISREFWSWNDENGGMMEEVVGSSAQYVWEGDLLTTVVYGTGSERRLFYMGDQLERVEFWVVGEYTGVLELYDFLLFASSGSCPDYVYDWLENDLDPGTPGL